MPEARFGPVSDVCLGGGAGTPRYVWGGSAAALYSRFKHTSTIPTPLLSPPKMGAAAGISLDVVPPLDLGPGTGWKSCAEAFDANGGGAGTVPFYVRPRVRCWRRKGAPVPEPEPSVSWHGRLNIAAEHSRLPRLPACCYRRALVPFPPSTSATPSRHPAGGHPTTLKNRRPRSWGSSCCWCPRSTRHGTAAPFSPLPAPACSPPPVRTG